MKKLDWSKLNTRRYYLYINNIIATRGQWFTPSSYYEVHHIIPKCINQIDDISNLINVYAREHFELHQILAEDNPNCKPLVYAYTMFIIGSKGRKNLLSADEYEKAKLLRSSVHKNDTVAHKKQSETMIKQYKDGLRLPWNKGLTKETDERIAKHAAIIKQKQLGKNNSMHNAILSKESHDNYRKASYRRHYIRIICLDNNKVYNSSEAACRDLGINLNKARKIREECRRLPGIELFGYHWKIYE